MREKLLELFESKTYQPKTFEEIYDLLQLQESDRIELKRELDKLVATYDIFLSRKKDKYILPKDVHIYKGTISIKNPDYGFITSASFEQDLYVPKHSLNNALDKDVVLFSPEAPYQDYYAGLKQEAKVIDILERSLKVVVGELKVKKDKFFLDVESDLIKKVKIIDNDISELCNEGDIVKVQITNYLKSPIEGKIIEKIGFKNDIGIDVLEIAASFNFPNKFEEKTLKELETLNQDISNEVESRRKPSLERIFTIDGEDAKDLDDAVAIRKLFNGNYLLGVYIADVSYFVKEDSALDEEALSRGTSVYLVDRVIPMLPTLISNNLCSLNPQQEKLVIACEMEIDRQGKVVNSDIFPSVIKTVHRMTYTNVNKILNDDFETIEKYKNIYEDILVMRELKTILNQMRVDRGALDFDVDESKIIVNNKGEVIDIKLIVRGESERLIEEFMLIANETVASTIYFLELPFIYRIHEEPNLMKLDAFKNLSRNLGYKAFKKKVNSKQLQDFLASVKPEDNFLKTILLRSMSKAIYNEKNVGHYGLGSECYTHFTSPIRRYPDLIVHRLLRKYLFNHDINASEFLQLNQKIAYIASQSSKKERDAIECEYQVEDMKKAEYMASFVGQKYEGIISSVTRFGMFVSLPNTVEGLVHMSSLQGRYLYDSKTMTLLGTNGPNYRLGDKVAIEVVKSDKKKREIDFKVVYNNDRVKSSGEKKHHRKKQKSFS